MSMGFCPTRASRAREPRYKDLEIKVTKMWRMKTETVAVVFGGLGFIKERRDQNLGKLPSAIITSMSCKDHPLGNGAYTISFYPVNPSNRVNKAIYSGAPTRAKRACDRTPTSFRLVVT